MAEITRKSVLIECLQIMRQELMMVSKKYDGLEPAERMEEAWEQGRKKIAILEDLIHAYDTEHVARALADWQKDIIHHGVQRELKFDGEGQVQKLD